MSGFKQKYVIGGKQYASRSEGAVVVKPQNQSFPVISYVGVCIKQPISCYFDGHIADVYEVVRRADLK